MMYIRCYIDNGKITNCSNLTRLQINVDIIVLCNRQFDLFFDTTHTDWCDTHTCITPSLTYYIALPTPKSPFYTTQHNATQHNNTSSPNIERKRKKPL